MLASASAGVLARFPCHPLDTCKTGCKFKMSEERPISNLVRRFEDGLDGGFRGLYRGFGITATGSAPAMCLYLSSYEICKDQSSLNPVLKNYPALTHLIAVF